jgi:3-dehydroquinate synthase II
MRRVYYKALPWVKNDVLLALESGVDGLIVPQNEVETARALARVEVLTVDEARFITLACKEDEEEAAGLCAALTAGRSDAPKLVALSAGWEIIPLENLLAASTGIAVEARSLEEARLAAGVLERGVDTIVLTSDSLPRIKEIIRAVRHRTPDILLQHAVITRIEPAGMGHRVCVDTTSLMQRGQGLLVGNSSAFTFLVNAETEYNEYVASRPFRVNAGGVHAYAVMPEDRTSYLGELAAGSEVLIVSHTGECDIATVGRVKVERRPMLLLEAEIPGRSGEKVLRGAVFLQNAETIRLVTPEGEPISVVDLKPGDIILCRADEAGRHFGMRIDEDIQEN